VLALLHDPKLFLYASKASCLLHRRLFHAFHDILKGNYVNERLEEVLKMSKRAAWCLIFCLWVSGCGKNMPEIDPVLLQSKTSVLVISKKGLSEPAAALIQKTLGSWRDVQHISYEWMKDLPVLEEEQLSKIKSTAYDYVIVVGNDLTRQAAENAGGITDKKWVLLDDALSSPTSINSPHILWKQTGEGFTEKQWQEWVKQQQVMGKRIEWVTNSNTAIPSVWAPSEEAETISLSDAEGWYPQFQHQVRQHGPDWIVVYAPLEASFLQRMKALQVPVMNISATSINLQWETLLASLLDSIQNKQWNPGVLTYTMQELSVTKPQ
jgi:hypothetical protein